MSQFDCISMKFINNKSTVTSDSDHYNVFKAIEGKIKQYHWMHGTMQHMYIVQW